MLIYKAIYGLVLGVFSIWTGMRIEHDWLFFVRKTNKYKTSKNEFFLRITKYKLLMVIITLLTSIILSIMNSIFHREEYLLFSVLLVLMLSSSVSDIIERIVPDRLIIICLPLMIILRIIFPTNPWYDAFLGSIVAFFFFFILGTVGEKLLKKEVIGGGDVKLYTVIGLMLGLENTLLSIFLSSVIGYMYIKIFKVSDETYLPFVPFITIGVFISYFFGSDILDWYFSFL